MSTLGVIRNPASSANHRARPLSLPDGTILVTPAAPEATGEAVRSLLSKGVRHIAIDGGDGTARLVIDGVLAAGGSGTVTLVLMRRGNTNLLCREIGGWPGLLGDLAGGIVVEQRLLRVEGADGARHGLILGLGAYERATRLASERPGPLGSAGVALAIGRALVSAATQGPMGPWRRGTPLALSVDGAAGHAGRRLLFAATTAEGRLPLGIDPFGRNGEGGIRWLDIDAPGRQLAAAASSILRGRFPPWLADAGYRTGRADTVRLKGAEALVIDGDVVPLEPVIALTITLSQPVRFLVPRATQGAGARIADGPNRRPAT
ncbi:MAG: hypothetical protein AAFQ75_07580 [Pseudomonadota bacterium]